MAPLLEVQQLLTVRETVDIMSDVRLVLLSHAYADDIKLEYRFLFQSPPKGLYFDITLSPWLSLPRPLPNFGGVEHSVLILDGVRGQVLH